MTCLFINDDADDHQFFREAIRKISSSIHCLFSFNAKEALDGILTHAIKPDLIFLDLKMPLMNGVHFLREKLKHTVISNIPVYIITDYIHDSVIDSLLLGVHDVIEKPFSSDDWEKRLIPVFSKHVTENYSR